MSVNTGERPYSSKMRFHKKTKESGFFEGDSSDTDGTNMGKALKRTKVFTTSSEYKRKVEYTQEELDTHIRNCAQKGRYFPHIFINIIKLEKIFKVARKVYLFVVL